MAYHRYHQTPVRIVLKGTVCTDSPAQSTLSTATFFPSGAGGVAGNSPGKGAWAFNDTATKSPQIAARTTVPRPLVNIEFMSMGLSLHSESSAA